MAQVIQFPHPGGEHSKISGSKWNEGPHKRKFMKYQGDILVDGQIKHTMLEFWGEYEPKTELLKTYPSPKPLYPKNLFYPLVPQNIPSERQTNTDPFIFGFFAFTVCKKFRAGKPTILNNGLNVGDLILFGSNLKDKFVLDTVFVVGKIMKITRRDYRIKTKSYGESFIKAALDPIFSNNLCEGGCKKPINEVTIHFGATYDKPVNEMYSFVPAQIYSEKSKGFKRPALKLSGIKPRSQNFTYIIQRSRLADVKSCWKSVKSTIENAGLYPAVKLDKIL
jgi:hypothetical protein